MSKLLVVEDDEPLLFILSKTLETSGFEVFPANCGETAINILNEIPDIDLVIADLIMPGIDGLKLCNYIRTNKLIENIPILIITGQSDIFYKCQGFDAGADDYVTKPVEFVELILRVKALLKRNRRGHSGVERQLPAKNIKKIIKSNKGNEIITKTGIIIRINKNNSTLVINDKEIYLTSTEFEIFDYMLNKKHEPIDSDELLEKIMNYPPGEGNPVAARTHIRNLRSKIENDPNNPEIIINIPKRGYILNIDFE